MRFWQATSKTESQRFFTGSVGVIVVIVVVRPPSSASIPTASAVEAFRVVTDVVAFIATAGTAGSHFRDALILTVIAEQVARPAVRTLRAIRVAVEDFRVSICQSLAVSDWERLHSSVVGTHLTEIRSLDIREHKVITWLTRLHASLSNTYSD